MDLEDIFLQDFVTWPWMTLNPSYRNAFLIYLPRVTPCRYTSDFNLKPLKILKKVLSDQAMNKKGAFFLNFCSGGRFTAMFCIYPRGGGETHGYLGYYWCYENEFWYE